MTKYRLKVDNSNRLRKSHRSLEWTKSCYIFMSQILNMTNFVSMKLFTNKLEVLFCLQVFSYLKNMSLLCVTSSIKYVCICMYFVITLVIYIDYMNYQFEQNSLCFEGLENCGHCDPIRKWSTFLNVNIFSKSEIKTSLSPKCQ